MMLLAMANAKNIGAHSRTLLALGAFMAIYMGFNANTISISIVFSQLNGDGCRSAVY